MSEDISNVDVSQIEVTPEMVSAGKSALLEYDDDYEFAEDAVVRVYLAMRSIERKKRKQS